MEKQISCEPGSYELDDIRVAYPGAIEALLDMPWASDFIAKHGIDDFYACIGFTNIESEGASAAGTLHVFSWEEKWLPGIGDYEWVDGAWVETAM